MVSKWIVFLFLMCTSGCSARHDVKPVVQEPALDITVSLRTTAEVNKQLNNMYIKRAGLPFDNLQNGHVTIGWLRGVDSRDFVPLQAYLRRYIAKINPENYTFVLDSLGEYEIDRKKGFTPFIFLPKNPAPFKRFNHFLNQYVKAFKGHKPYSLTVGTEPERFVPHLTVLHEDLVNAHKFDRDVIKKKVNHWISARPYSFKFKSVEVRTKGEYAKLRAKL